MSDFDPTVTLISEYANSPTIRQLVDSLDQQINPAPLFDSFYSYVWNIDTAQGFGLDILGRIIDLPREVQNVPAIYPVTVAPGTVSLTDDQYRRALLVKAWANISSSSAKSINAGLRMTAIGRGNAFARNLGNMRMEYVFYYAPDPYEYAIIAAANVVTKPAGVGFNMVTINPYLGFSEAESWDTFGQAVFANY